MKSNVVRIRAPHEVLRPGDRALRRQRNRELADELRVMLRGKRMELMEISLSKLSDADVRQTRSRKEPRVIITRMHDERAWAIIPLRAAGVLLGNSWDVRVDAHLSACRTASGLVAYVLEHEEAVGLQYCLEDIGVLMFASKLVERLKR